MTPGLYRYFHIGHKCVCNFIYSFPKHFISIYYVPTRDTEIGSCNPCLQGSHRLIREKMNNM